MRLHGVLRVVRPAGEGAPTFCDAADFWPDRRQSPADAPFPFAGFGRTAAEMSPRLPFLRTLPASSLFLLLVASGAAQAGGLADERRRLPSPAGPARACVALDWDGDGIVDLVRASALRVEVLLQDPAGRLRRLQPPIPLPVRGEIVELAVVRPARAKPRVVVGVAGGVSQLLEPNATGAARWRTPSPFGPPSGPAPAFGAVVVGDLDGRNGDDVVFVPNLGPARWFAGDGGGGFSDGGNPLSAVLRLRDPLAALADMDGRFGPDLVLTAGNVAMSPLLFLNDGKGRLRWRSGAFGTLRPVIAALALGDVDGDGRTDVAVARASVPAAPVVVLRNTGGGFRAVIPSGGLRLHAPRRLLLRRVDRDATLDLVALERSGELWAAANLGRWRFGPPLRLLPEVAGPALRAHRPDVVVTDLDGDGDGDVYVPGAGVEDALLLGSGRWTFSDTERITAPFSLQAGFLPLELVDVAGPSGRPDGDPDIVQLAATGRFQVWGNDGSARFRVSSSASMPSLGPGRWSDLRRAAISAPGREELLALGLTAAGATVRVLVRRGSKLVDESTTRWPAPGSWSVEHVVVGDFVAGGPDTAGLDDVVAVVSSGSVRGLALGVNRKGVFRVDRTVFGVHGLRNVTGLLAGRVNGDAYLDLVVLQGDAGFEVFLGGAGGRFQRVSKPVIGRFPARAAALSDLTGDGRADLVLASSLTPNAGIVRLFEGRGDGTFRDATWRLPKGSRIAVVSAAALDRGDNASVVLGTASGECLRLTRWGGRLVLQALPTYGGLRADRLTTGDLDLDGDDDLVVSRQDATPLVLLGGRTQLVQTGVAQVGRRLTLRLRGTPGGRAFFFTGAPAKVRLPGLGWLRLSLARGIVPVFDAAVPASGVLDLPPVRIGDSWKPGQVGLQAAILEPGPKILLTNLEQALVVGF